MDSMNIQTNMELEHQDMLTRNLGLRKKAPAAFHTFFLENNKLELEIASASWVMNLKPD